MACKVIYKGKSYDLSEVVNTIAQELKADGYSVDLDVNSKNYGKITAAKEATPAKQVETLRAKEQAELLKAIPNIEEARVDGEVDRAKLSEADRKTFDKIYNKYDKLITPLLEESATETTKEEKKVTLTTEQKKQVAADSIDELAERLKKALKIELPEGIKFKGINQDALIDLAAQLTKALVNTGMDIQAAINAVTEQIQKEGVLNEDQKAAFTSNVLDKVSPKQKETIPKGKKKRKTVTTAEQAAADKGMRLDRQDDDYYTPQNQAEIVENISKLSAEQLLEVSDDSKSPMSIRNAAAIELFRRRVNEGNESGARDILNKLKERNTDLGQAIAMMATLKSSTPDGIVAMVIQAVESAGREIASQRTAKKKTTRSTKEQAKQLATKVRKAKFIRTVDQLSKLQSDPTAIFKVAWDGALEAFATTIELSGDVFEAVDNAVKKIKDSDWYKGLSEDGKKKADEIVRKDLEEEGLRHTQTGREILKVRNKLQDSESQLEKLRGIAEELIEAQGEYIEFGKKLAAGEDVNQDSLRKAEKRVSNAEKKMDIFINNVLPRTWGDLLQTSIKGNLLTIKSLVKNPVYNIFRMMAQVPSEMMGEVARRIFNVSSDVSSFILGKPRGDARGTAVFSISAYIHGLRYGLPKGLREAGVKFASGKNAANLNFEYQMSRGFMPMRAMAASISNTKLGDALGVERDLMSVKKDGTVSVGDRLKKVYEGSFPSMNAELMFRLLPFGDNPFYRMVEAKEMYIIAKQRGLKGEAFKRFLKYPPKDAIEEASVMAKESVYQEDSDFADWALKMTRRPVKTRSQFLNNTIEALSGVLFPFVKTPVNVATQTADYAIPPYSVIKGFYYYLNYRKSKDPRDLRKGHEMFGKAFVGAMMIDAALILVTQGLVTGALYGSGDDEERKQRDLAYGTGFRPNSINITGLKRYSQPNGTSKDAQYREGDELKDYRIWGPFGAIIGMQANYSAFEKRLDAREARRDVLGAESRKMNEFLTEFGNIPEMVSYFQEQSFLAGTNTLLEAAKSKGDKNAVNRAVAQAFKAASTVVLPNNLSLANKASSEFMVDLRGKTLGETFKNVILDRTFQTDDLPVRYDYFGNKIENTPKGENPFVYHFLDPFSTSEIRSNKVAKELQKVLGSEVEGADLSMIQALPNKNFSLEGQNYRMDADQYNHFINKRQTFMTESLEKLFKQSYYKNSSFEQKVELIKEEYSYVSSSDFVYDLKEDAAKKIKKQKLSPK
jgi:hypothetical protein